MMYIHEKGLVHGDVRPRTIAVHSNLRVAKLCDFGCTTGGRKGWRALDPKHPSGATRESSVVTLGARVGER